VAHIEAQAAETDLHQAREALALIADRRFNRGKSLQDDFAKMLAERPETGYRG
jgi:hypothetical protein